LGRRLIDAGRPPLGFVASASTPPRGGQADPDLGPQALRALLIAYDPQNREILANDELFATLAPALRDDIALLRRHRIDPGLCLDMPALLLSGGDDRVVPASAAARWAAHFSGSVAQETLPGGHQFPFRESGGAVLDRLAPLLRRGLGRQGAG
jgi:surfactin synthase thioesterase subunit